MKVSNPLTPQEILENREIDHRIIDAVNQILKDKFIGHDLKITLPEIKDKMVSMFGGINFKDLFDRKQFDFEKIYEKYGWKVEFDKPGYSENYDSFYMFRPKK